MAHVFFFSCYTCHSSTHSRFLSGCLTTLFIRMLLVTRALCWLTKSRRNCSGIQWQTKAQASSTITPVIHWLLSVASLKWSDIYRSKLSKYQWTLLWPTLWCIQHLGYIALNGMISDLEARASRDLLGGTECLPNRFLKSHKSLFPLLLFLHFLLSFLLLLISSLKFIFFFSTFKEPG